MGPGTASKGSFVGRAAELALLTERISAGELARMVRPTGSRWAAGCWPRGSRRSACGWHDGHDNMLTLTSSVLV
jgi:hypothetical protein